MPDLDTIEINDKSHVILLHEDIKALRQEMNSFGREVTTALNKLVKIEEKQGFMAKAYESLQRQAEKAEAKHDALELRVDALEKDAPMNKKVTNWVLTLMSAVAIGVITAGLKIFGIV